MWTVEILTWWLAPSKCFSFRFTCEPSWVSPWRWNATVFINHKNICSTSKRNGSVCMGYTAINRCSLCQWWVRNGALIEKYSEKRSNETKNNNCNAISSRKWVFVCQNDEKFSHFRLRTLLIALHIREILSLSHSFSYSLTHSPFYSTKTTEMKICASSFWMLCLAFRFLCCCNENGIWVKCARNFMKTKTNE